MKFNWSKYKVLIVEDDEINYQLLKVFLKNTSIQIIHASSGTEVMDIFEEIMPDIVLMDVQLPSVNGIQLTEMMKSQHPEIPIIVQTASILETQMQEMMDIGCEDYLMKPISRENLILVMKKYLN
jgi:two-component system, cell cycle response regulator DivK